MLQNRLSSLSIIYMHSEILPKLCYEQIVNLFGSSITNLKWNFRKKLYIDFAFFVYILYIFILK